MDDKDFGWEDCATKRRRLNQHLTLLVWKDDMKVVLCLLRTVLMMMIMKRDLYAIIICKLEWQVSIYLANFIIIYLNNSSGKEDRRGLRI